MASLLLAGSCASHTGCRQTLPLAKVFATDETLASDELTEFATGEKLKPKPFAEDFHLSQRPPITNSDLHLPLS